MSLPLLGNTKHDALGDRCVAKIIEQHAAAAIMDVLDLQDVLFRGLFLQLLLRRRRLRCRLHSASSVALLILLKHLSMVVSFTLSVL